MGGLFGVVAKESAVLDVFFGTDYHSHLGTSHGGMVLHGADGFKRSVHNIENAPFRTRFEDEINWMTGTSGIGCISDTEPQPLIVRSHLGSYALSTVGRINNSQKLIHETLSRTNTHFLEMSGGTINPTELVAALINQCDTLVEGLRFVQEQVEGSMTLLVLTEDTLYAARDRHGRTPLSVGKGDQAYCVSLESFAYLNLGYSLHHELGPAEIVALTVDGMEQVSPPGNDLRICSFLWIYYGYPTSAYEGQNVEQVRYRCGGSMACREDLDADLVAGVPDSGIAHAIGYANQSGLPFARPFIKYTPTWPRSFTPPQQAVRELIAKMKIIAIDSLIRGQKLVLIDDSIVRGTQLRETTDYLYQCGASQIHIRPACPPILYSCPYLNFSRTGPHAELITRKMIQHLDPDPDQKQLAAYADPDDACYQAMVEAIRRELNFTSLSYNRLDDMKAAIQIDPNHLCTYCWNQNG